MFDIVCEVFSSRLPMHWLAATYKLWLLSSVAVPEEQESVLYNNGTDLTLGFSPNGAGTLFVNGI